MNLKANLRSDVSCELQEEPDAGYAAGEAPSTNIFQEIQKID